MSLLGRQIGRYRILEQLGSGGMSVVYKGLDTALDREVAVKVLHPHLAKKEESRKRLAREAKAVAKLHHPNILEVFDFAGADSEDAYIVTELIRGQTLRDYANGTSFEPPELAAMVIHELASALAHAHEAGIIHRDLKPENVMVRSDGLLKLMDFGIAKIIDRDDKMTMTGALVGSPAHMAPEIIEGEEVGPEADVFSLGTMLYFLATTRLPFTGPNTTATLKKILDCVYEDPRQLVPTVSDDLAEIIATCLSRQPSARYKDAGKLKDALAQYLAGLGFTRIGEELHSFFADPPSYRKIATAKMCEALVTQGETYAKEKRPAKALSSLNQVLALDPHNARALELLQQMNHSRKRERGRRTGLIASAAVVLVAAVASGAVKTWSVLTRVPDFSPSAIRADEVVLSASLFPAGIEHTTELPPPHVEELVKLPPANDAVVVKGPDKKLLGLKAAVDRSKTEKPPVIAPSNLVDVTLNVRPFGAIQVDDGALSASEGLVHNLKLPPGKHRVKISCKDRCEDTVEEIDVSPDGPKDFKLTARGGAAFVSFDFQPRDAVVRVNDQSMSVADTVATPMRIAGKKGSFVNEVAYEIVRKGYKTKKDVVSNLKPGDRRQVTGSLEPE
ncbi:MAG: protein kinase domain-containing protein [Myxococcaceae bacterium]